MTIETRTARIIVLSAFALSGAAALAYEVIWTRALSVVLGSTTHATSSMLATFMLGLALGGLAGGKLSDRKSDVLRYAAFCELGIGALAIGTLFLIRMLPGAYLSIYRAAHLDAPAFFTLQVVLCSAIMLPPTFLMGMTFPLITRALTDSGNTVGAAVGHAYGVNTLGSVAGALLSGFALVPMLGLRSATIAAAVANSAAAALLLGARGRLRPRALAAALALLGVLSAATRWIPTDWTHVSIYTAARYATTEEDVVADQRRALHPIFAEEGPDGRVAAFRDGPHLVLQVGGKLEGTGASDLPNTLLLAYLPAAMRPDPQRALIIGLGSGVTLAAARRVFPSVEVVEINRSVLRAVAAHGPPGVLDGLPIHRNDARTFLLYADTRFDVISSEPSYPSDFSVGNLFTREYYATAAGRLAPGGVYCQWLPYYLLTNDDVTMMVKTFGEVFPHVTVWKVPATLDLLMLGSLEPLTATEEQVRSRVSAFNEAGTTLDFVLSRTPAQARQVVADREVPVNTDDRPLLEFRLARNLRVGQLSLLERR